MRAVLSGVVTFAFCTPLLLAQEEQEVTEVVSSVRAVPAAQIEAFDAAIQEAMRTLQTGPGIRLIAGPPRQDPAGGPGIDPADAGPAMRIWAHAERGHQELWFRRSVELTELPKRATLVFSCDNVATVFVNGEQVAHCKFWEELTIIDVLPHLKKGKNTIAIHAKNEGSCAALAAWFLTTDGKGNQTEVVTDAEWRYAEDEHEGWAKPDFDDSDWNAANATFATPYGKNVYGMEPNRLHFENALSKTTNAIELALQQLRAARTPEAAQKALDAIDRAVMNTRAALWKQKAAAKKK